MQGIVLTVGGYQVSAMQAAFGFGLAVVLLLGWMVLSLRRSSFERTLEAAAATERAREMDDKVAEMNRLQAELTSRMQTMAEIFGSRQSDMTRLVAERLDGLRSHLGQGLEASGKTTTESLQKLNERLAVIDSAQKNLTDLTSEMMSLKDVLSNKQARGAYGQGRMEAIVRDGLPASAYDFQVTLSNRTRPDCVISLPGDTRKLVIDAKFPLEGFTAYRSAESEDQRRQAAARVRADMGNHIKDIADKYVAAEETQDMALMFVPSEAIHADLHEHFEDLVQRSHRARVVIVSPSLLALAIQVMQSLVRDARMRDEARVIQTEVAKLLDDVRRLSERVEKLDTHFRQASDDVSQIRTSSDKILKRGERIEALEFEDQPAQGALPAAPPHLRAAE
ncbi:MAG: DNA recombination protein RmuC [Beijerinckiaceae bacterium]|jgi:DNA recombination protein RmuC|nr:DNA recombination protein RmuC [Beijerinckiaceae bacterium]